MVYNNIKHQVLLCIYKRLASGHQKHQCNAALDMVYTYLIFMCSIVLLQLYCIVVMEVTLFIGSDTHIIIG